MVFVYDRKRGGGRGCKRDASEHKGQIHWDFCNQKGHSKGKRHKQKRPQCLYDRYAQNLFSRLCDLFKNNFPAYHHPRKALENFYEELIPKRVGDFCRHDLNEIGTEQDAR